MVQEFYMNIKKSFIFLLLLTGTLFTSVLCASTFFSGYAGGKLNYSADSEAEDYNADLKLQAFFAGQFNFSNNLWSHLEFSIDTKDFISESIFHETDSVFQIDEASLIVRGTFNRATNYFSSYMGTYDPIGSDIFLQRYFSINSIASKITDSYLGLAGSILYPHFGLGIADVFKLHEYPLAFGGYMYFNHEDSKYFVYNADLRAACVYRYLTCDLACGIGAPLANKYKGEAVFIAIDKFYWHAGTTVLIGNNFTNSLFIQAGLYNAAFTAKNDNVIVGPEDLYILFEPRFLFQNFHFNFTLYSLPPNTIKKLLLVDDTLGLDLNFYTESAFISAKPVTIGAHVALSFKDKSVIDFGNIAEIASEGFNLCLTPYIQTSFLSGELHFQGKMNVMTLASEVPGKAFSADLGYRTKF